MATAKLLFRARISVPCNVIFYIIMPGRVRNKGNKPSDLMDASFVVGNGIRAIPMSIKNRYVAIFVAFPSRWWSIKIINL